MRRILLWLSVLVCCFSLTGIAAEPKQPKLLLAVVIDQFRYDYLLRFESQYHAGFARLLQHGAVFTDAHLQHFPTVTAIGHSTFLSGATPSLSGIVGNEWYDRESKRQVTSVSDDDVRLVGVSANQTGSSPRRLLVDTIPDQLKMEGKRGKAISVSIKDRAAILPLGHMGDGAYWFDDGEGVWVTSSYYMKELPKWVQDINASHPAAKYANSTWMPVDAGSDAKPLCSMVKGGGVRWCQSIEATPWGNEMIESFAEQALVAEQLGKHSGTDVLTVSFSSNDYVGHRMGPDSPDVRDMCIRTDRVLGKLLDFVDQQVGAGNFLFVMTADHGVAPIPEVNQARKMPGGRLSESELMQEITSVLTAKYGPGKWIVGKSGPVPYLNKDLIASKNLNEAEVEGVAADAVRKMPHVFRVYTREQLLAGLVPEDYVSRALRNGLYPKRSGDLFVIPEPYYLYDPPPGTSHGTPFNYDTHIPIIFMGPGIKPGRYHQPIVANDIAPTLSDLLSIEEPSGSVGRVLSEMFEKGD